MKIEKAAVLGAGTMGAQIAAHLANASVPTLLFDIAHASDAEEQTKVALETKAVRNRIAQADLTRRKQPSLCVFSNRQSALSASANSKTLCQIKDFDLIIDAVFKPYSKQLV